jgi:hypothetical protein
MNSQLSIKKKLGKFCIVLTVPTRRVETAEVGIDPFRAEPPRAKVLSITYRATFRPWAIPLSGQKTNEYRRKSNFPVASSASDNDVRLRGYNA